MGSLLCVWPETVRIYCWTGSPRCAGAAGYSLGAGIRQGTQNCNLLLRRVRGIRQSASRTLGQSFAVRRAAWRFKRKYACRHGVLCSAMPVGGCKCMDSSSTPADWANAEFMPTLSEELEIIVATKFDLESFVRLGALQAQMRQMGW